MKPPPEVSDGGAGSPDEDSLLRLPEHVLVDQHHDHGEYERPGNDFVRSQQLEEESKLATDTLRSGQSLDDEDDLPREGERETDGGEDGAGNLGKKQVSNPAIPFPSVDPSHLLEAGIGSSHTLVDDVHNEGGDGDGEGNQA